MKRLRPAAADSAPVLTLRRAGALTALFAFPLIVDLYGVLLIAGGHNFFDFTIFRHAGAAVLDGRSPWETFGFVYPAPAALAFVPFGLIPYHAAGAIFLGTNVAALFATLWILGVRDWRCYAVASATAPVQRALIAGTISPWIGLALAVAWRYRNQAVVVGTALAAAISLKIFVWPMIFWLIATRRFRAAVITTLTTAVTMVVAWLIVGVGTVSQFLHATAADFGRNTFSVFALWGSLGLATASAYAAVGLVGGILVVLIFRAVKGTQGDWKAYVAALGASLALTPIVHIHYLVLLLIPIAVARPRLGFLWTLPFAFYGVLNHAGSNGSPGRILWVLALVAVLLLIGLLEHSPDDDSHQIVAEPRPVPG